MVKEVGKRTANVSVLVNEQLRNLVSEWLPGRDPTGVRGKPRFQANVSRETSPF
jgi:hypothetical protein